MVFIRAAVALAASVSLCAQCIVRNPGGNKININRPREADVPGAGFSPMAYLNREIPGWLCFDAGFRARFEGYAGGVFQPNNSDDYLLSRFRVGALLKPSSTFQIYAELQDAHAFWKKQPVGPPYQTTWDLRRAWVDLGVIELNPISFRIGRQDLNFGEGRILGTSYWRNASRGYDAAMAVIHWNWLYVNAFASAPVMTGANGLSHHQQGNNLHGIYSTVRNLIPGTDLEPYVLWRLTPGLKAEAGTPARLDEKVLGMRWAGTRGWWDLTSEAVLETGQLGADRIRAWAGMAALGYTFDKHRTRPRLFAEFDFASGDRNPRDGSRGTFDQISPNVHGHNGLADQVAWQNLKEVRAGARISVRRNWNLAMTYNNWWLASATDAFYNSSGGVVARDTSGRSGTHIGQEYDVETILRVNRLLEFGAGVGAVMPGEFLKRTGHSRTYIYPYIMLNYNFY